MQISPDIKNHTISARFPKKLVKQLKLIAKEKDRSVSYVLQVAAEQFVESHKA